MTGDHHPFGAAEVGEGEHRVAVADHPQVRERTQGRLHQARKPGLVTAFGLGIDNGAEQGHQVAARLKAHGVKTM